MKPWNLSVLGCLAIMLSVVAAGVSYACSCPPPTNAAAQLEQADLMIVARVSSVRRLPPQDGRPMAETRFVVTETVKGPQHRVWTIRHQRCDSAMCGMDFRPARDYAVLARFAGGKVWTSACERAWFPVEDYRASATRQPQEAS